jgi:predicted phage terminase large subunit-like protein
MNAVAEPDEYALFKAKDELDRYDARENFLAYYQRMTGYSPPKHLKVIAKLCQAMEDDKIDRAMVFAPPRHIKTLSCSKLFPSWLMGRKPTTPIMSVVHTQAYAGKVGRAVRNYLRHPAWPFDDVRLSDDSQAREYWTTPQGGEYNGFGATAGNQHGSPAEWLFMDDIVKGREVAMSALQREQIWENYETDMLSRLQGRRKQLMVFTRWHQDDPAGRILPDNFDGRTGWYKDKTTGELWFVLCLPAVCEHDNDPVGRKPGEWLWDEAFGEKQLGAIRKRGGYFWSALYQQRPSPVEGLMFRAEHLLRYDPLTLPITDLTIYIASDYAVTAEAGASDPDWTVHGVWGVDQDINLYLLDGWRGRFTADRWAAEWIRLCKKWKPLMAFEEQGQILKTIDPFLVKMMQEERVFVARQQFTSSTKKEARAQGLLGMASMGKLFLPKKESLRGDLLALVEAFEKEILQFPGGKHDDTVDQATLMARGLNSVLAGKKPKGGKNAADETLNELIARHEAEQERRRKGQS